MTKEQVEAILKQAVGFDPQRTDQIEVLVTKLAGLTAADPLAGIGAPVWEQYRELIRVASLGVGSLVALLLGLLILRRLRPVSLAASPLTVVRAARSQQIADLQAKIVTNPEIVSRIIEAWLKQTGQGEAETPPDAVRAKGTKRAA